MKTETKFRAALVMSLLGLAIMTFEYFEKDRIYNEYKVSTTKQIDSLIETQFLLNNEIGIEELVLDSLFTKYPKLQKEHDHIKNESNLFE